MRAVSAVRRRPVMVGASHHVRRDWFARTTRCNQQGVRHTVFSQKPGGTRRPPSPGGSPTSPRVRRRRPCRHVWTENGWPAGDWLANSVPPAGGTLAMRARRRVARSSLAASRTCSGGWSGRTFQCTCVQSQQRDPVREHVVHLAGYAGALSRPRAQRAPLIGLGMHGPLAQREKKLTSGGDVHSPGGGRERARGCERDHRYGVGPPRVDGVDQGGRDHIAATSSAGRPGQCTARENSANNPAGVADNENAQRDTGQRDAEWRAPPPPQRQACQQPTCGVDHHLPRRPTVAPTASPTSCRHSRKNDVEVSRSRMKSGAVSRDDITTVGRVGLEPTTDGL